MLLSFDIFLHVCSADSHSFKASSLVFNTPMSGKAQAALLQALTPDKAAYLQLRALGGAVNDVGVEQTAFPHRNATIDIQVYRNHRDHMPSISYLCKKSSILPNAPIRTGSKIL